MAPMWQERCRKFFVCLKRRVSRHLWQTIAAALLQFILSVYGLPIRTVRRTPVERSIQPPHTFLFQHDHALRGPPTAY